MKLKKQDPDLTFMLINFFYEQNYSGHEKIINIMNYDTKNIKSIKITIVTPVSGEMYWFGMRHRFIIHCTT